MKKAIIAFIERLWRRSFPARSVSFDDQVKHLKSFIQYDITKTNSPSTKPELKKLVIYFIIPDFVPGAGGHMTIFRIASYLERFGHKVHFLIQNPSVHHSGEDALQTINTHFQSISGSVTLFNDKIPDVSGDALIATDRFTCYPARAMTGFHETFYFVQDFEPQFYPMGTEYLLTEATYRFGFSCLCAGEWLQTIMQDKYGAWSRSWPLACDTDVYFEDAKTAREEHTIAVYARFVTPRRAVELVYLALENLALRGMKFKVEFFGWPMGDIQPSFEFVDHGVLSSNELSDLYRRATVGVVFSATNHSLANKEMMACGLPVVDLDEENVRTIFPNDVMAFAKPSPLEIADTLERLLVSPDERLELSNKASEYVAAFSWEKSARVVEDAIKERLVDLTKEAS